MGAALTRTKFGLAADRFHASAPVHCLLMLSGADGRLGGPAGLFTDLRRRIIASPSLRILTVQMAYRHPGRMEDALTDVAATLQRVRDTYGVHSVVLLGWSFGGAVAVAAAGQDALTHPHTQPGAVVGLVTLGTQTDGTACIRRLHESALSCLFLHGGADAVLPDACSHELYGRYRGADKELLVYEGDDHACSRSRQAVLDKVDAWLHRVFTAREAADDSNR